MQSSAVLCKTIREECSHFLAYRLLNVWMWNKLLCKENIIKKAGRSTEKPLGWCRYYTEWIPSCGMAMWALYAVRAIATSFKVRIKGFPPTRTTGPAWLWKSWVLFRFMHHQIVNQVPNARTNFALSQTHVILFVTGDQGWKGKNLAEFEWLANGAAFQSKSTLWKQWRL